MLYIINTKPRRGSIWITPDTASPEGCGRGMQPKTLCTTVPEGLNLERTHIQPLRGWMDVVGLAYEPMTAPLRGCFVMG